MREKQVLPVVVVALTAAVVAVVVAVVPLFGFWSAFTGFGV